MDLVESVRALNPSPDDIIVVHSTYKPGHFPVDELQDSIKALRERIHVRAVVVLPAGWSLDTWYAAELREAQGERDEYKARLEAIENKADEVQNGPRQHESS